MTRAQFTKELAALLQYMINNGESPIIDFVKRSTEEQQRLFNAGLSKCDGIKNPSRHQSGRAADIYLVDAQGNMIDWNKIPEKSATYHDFWEQSGGRMRIEWDRGHFEG